MPQRVGPHGKHVSRKQFGTGTTNGRFVKVAATATAGTLLHTHNRQSQFQRVRVDAWTTDSADRLLTLEWAGVTSPDDLIEVKLYADAGPRTVACFLLEKGKTVRAFAAAANVVNCYVEVTDEE